MSRFAEEEIRHNKDKFKLENILDTTRYVLKNKTLLGLRDQIETFADALKGKKPYHISPKAYFFGVKFQGKTTILIENLS